MSVIKSLFASSTGISDTQNPRLWLVDALSGRKTHSGEHVSPGSAMGLSAYFACLRCVSEDVGKLPLNAYRKRADRGKDKDTAHVVHRMVHDLPNDEMTAMTFREMLTHWAMGWGNGCAEIERTNGGDPIAMHPIHPSRIVPRRNVAGEIEYLIRNDDGTFVVIPSRDMIHIRGLGETMTGYSVCRLASESIGLGLAAQTFGAAFFGNGANVGSVLSHPGRLKDDALRRLRESWAEIHQGAANAGKPAILEEGMKYDRIGLPPEEAQFLETRQFQVEDIARWFRVPPHKIQHLLRSTNNNIEHQSIEYVTDAMMPWLVRWEQELKRKLLANESDMFVEHVVQGLLRGDQAARSAYYRERFMIGTLSQNDIRELENENPIEHGDTYYIPMNMTTAKRAESGEGATGKAPPTVAPMKPPAAMSSNIELYKKAAARVFADAAQRAITKESHAANRAAKKHAGDAKAFTNWMADFYADFEGDVVDAYASPVQSLADLVAGPDGMTPALSEAVRRIILSHAAAHVAVSMSELHAAFASGAVESCCEQWAKVRPSEIVNKLTDQTADTVLAIQGAHQ